MNITDYIYLLNKPDAINEKHADTLDHVIAAFPYFQSARVLKLKHLYNQDSFNYNYSLKIAAAFTTDRSVLFDFITSDTFISIQKGLYEKKTNELLNINVIASEQISLTSIPVNDLIEESIVSSIKKATATEDTNASEKLALGKPLSFSLNEKHSFQEWLQLSRLNPIEREPDKLPDALDSQTKMEVNDTKKTNLDLIDTFIENNPKISPVNKDTKVPVTAFISEDTSFLMTETLARVYLEQKKYLKAIQAYEILILKYPEKSSFFANRILDIKILQQNNN